MQFSISPVLSVLIIMTNLVANLFAISIFPDSEINMGRSQNAQTPAFTTAPCMFKLPAGVKDGEGIKCGYLSVPEQHAHPDGPSIRLAVAIIESRDPNPKSDPLIMAQGGPGGSTIETYAETLLSKRNFIPNRDIVLFDQRGTKYSDPDLYCTEVDKLITDTIDQRLSDAEDEKLSLEAMQACHTRLVGENINLSAFNSLENASDIEDLRKALGYKQINLYGVSYGTLLALHFMQMYPQSLRSVILDGVVPPQTNFILNSAKTMDQDFSRLFSTCQENPDCNRAYPDLEKVFFKLVDDLNQNPVKLTLSDKDTNKKYPNAVIDGDTFMSGIFQMLYVGSIIPALPRVIYDAKNGNFDFFQRIYSIFLFDHSLSLGMYYSVVCTEEANFTPADQDLSGVRPQIAKNESREPKNILDVCKTWDVKAFSPEIDKPVSSDVPTLLLSGGFDPITPAIYADTAAQTLKNEYVFVFPAGGHGQALEGDCQNNIIQSFLDNPSQKPDGACIAGINKVTFFTPANTIDIPAMIQIMNLEGNSGIELLGLFIASFYLLTAFPGIPVIWLINRSRRKKQRQHPITSEGSNPIFSDGTIPPAPLSYPQTPSQILPNEDIPPGSTFLGKTAGWVAFIAGPVLAIFMLGLTILVFDMVIKNDNRLFFGVSASARILFVLPLLFLLLSFWMFFAGLVAWVKAYWSIWTRLYYSSLVIAAIISLAILAVWGVLTAIV